MPVSPVIPSQIKATIPAPSGNFCEKMLRFLIDGPTLIYNWYSSVYNEDGSFSDDFKSMVCSIDCSAVSGGGSTTIAAPTLTWTPGATPRMSWNTVTNAAYYELLRGTTSDIVAATLLAVTSLNFYDDAAATVNVQYFYWVRGVNATAQGPYSAIAVGGQAVYTVAAPTIAATENIATHVEVTWARINNATLYDVVRNTSNTTAGATSLGTTAQRYFDDFTGTFGTAYYYFVRARNASATSAYSTGDVGQRA